MRLADTRPPFAGLANLSEAALAALPTPCYLLDEARLRRNGEILLGVQQRTGCKILLAQKAFSNYDLYPCLLYTSIDRKNTVDCTKPNTGIISRLDSLPAQEKPAMASTPRPPSSPCLTVVMMVPLACWTLLGACLLYTSGHP